MRCSHCGQAISKEGSGSIFPEIYNFLVKHERMPIVLPTIEEMGKYPGGYAFVKRIHSLGGLRRFRPEYTEYAALRYTADIKAASSTPAELP
jgi:hypothetical protein